MKKRPGIKGHIEEVKNTARSEMKKTGIAARSSISEVKEEIIDILKQGLSFKLSIGGHIDSNGVKHPSIDLPVELKLTKINAIN